MNPEIERFGKDLKSNESLRAAVKAAGADYPAIVKIANSKGYKFTADDVSAVVASGELSDAQLEGVAGGAWSVFVYKGGMFITSN